MFNVIKKKESTIGVTLTNFTVVEGVIKTNNETEVEVIEEVYYKSVISGGFNMCE